MGRMKTIEKKLEELQEAIVNSNNQASSRLNSFKSQSQFQSNHGRGYGRRYARGYGRGYSKGSFGRGYQNQNQNQTESSDRGRDYSRVGQQGGTNGRGANRGGRGTGGSQRETFYNNMNPQPQLHAITEFGLSVQSANGTELPFKVYIEAEFSAPILSDCVLNIPLLVVSDTEYNSQVPAIVGTNVIRLCKAEVSNHEVPVEWQTAFDLLCDDSIPVKTTSNYAIRIAPYEVKTIHGLARKTADFEIRVNGTY